MLQNLLKIRSEYQKLSSYSDAVAPRPETGCPLKLRPYFSAEFCSGSNVSWYIDLLNRYQLYDPVQALEIKSDTVWTFYHREASACWRARIDDGLKQAVILVVDPSPCVKQTLDLHDYDLSCTTQYEVARRRTFYHLLEHATPIHRLYFDGLSIGGTVVSTENVGPFASKQAVNPASLILECIGSRGFVNEQNIMKLILHLSSSLHDFDNFGFWAHHETNFSTERLDSLDSLSTAAVLPRTRIFDQDGSFKRVNKIISAIKTDVNYIIHNFNVPELLIGNTPATITEPGQLNSMDRLLLRCADIAAGFARHWYEELAHINNPLTRFTELSKKFRCVVYNSKIIK